jgi:hypothetical protein
MAPACRAAMPFSVLPEVLLQYRKVPTSVLNAGAAAMWHSAQLVVERAMMRTPYALARKRRAVIADRLRRCAWADGFNLQPVGYFLRALLGDPSRALTTALNSRSSQNPVEVLKRVARRSSS